MRTYVRSADSANRLATVTAPAPDDLLARKTRGAFFTPPAIAHVLGDWWIGTTPSGRVLTRTGGDGVFLWAEGERLRALGSPPATIQEQLSGIDVHAPSLNQAKAYLREDKLDATLVQSDFFEVLT